MRRRDSFLRWYKSQAILFNRYVSTDNGTMIWVRVLLDSISLMERHSPPGEEDEALVHQKIRGWMQRNASSRINSGLVHNVMEAQTAVDFLAKIFVWISVSPESVVSREIFQAFLFLRKLKMVSHRKLGKTCQKKQHFWNRLQFERLCTCFQ